jgi:hypothetical protein
MLRGSSTAQLGDDEVTTRAMEGDIGSNDANKLRVNWTEIEIENERERRTTGGP